MWPMYPVVAEKEKAREVVPTAAQNVHYIDLGSALWIIIHGQPNPHYGYIKHRTP